MRSFKNRHTGDIVYSGKSNTYYVSKTDPNTCIQKKYVENSNDWVEISDNKNNNPLNLEVGKTYKLQYKGIGIHYTFKITGITKEGNPIGSFGSVNITLSDRDWILIGEYLFTTDDNVDIYENDIVHVVDNLWFINEFAANKRMRFTKKNVFSTKEKAEEYIILNKPCLSINNVKNNLPYNIDNCFNENTINNLKKLVKYKINNGVHTT